MEEYKKMTKDMIDFPEYVLGFLSVIVSKLRFYGMIDGFTPKVGSEAATSLIMPIVSKKYRYCYEGIALVEKTMNKRGFKCQMKSYRAEESEDGKLEYHYNFSVTKIEEENK